MPADAITRQAKAVVAGLVVVLALGIGALWATGAPLTPALAGALVVVCCAAGSMAGVLHAGRRRRRRADGWQTFEREFWRYVQERPDTKHSHDRRA